MSIINRVKRVECKFPDTKRITNYVSIFVKVGSQFIFDIGASSIIRLYFYVNVVPLKIRPWFKLHVK